MLQIKLDVSFSVFELFVHEGYDTRGLDVDWLTSRLNEAIEGEPFSLASPEDSGLDRWTVRLDSAPYTSLPFRRPHSVEQVWEMLPSEVRVALERLESLVING